MLLEIATNDYCTTQQAVEAGADRIELCSNMAQGGTTPSYAHIKMCRDKFSLPIFVMIRPRGGDFHFSPEEWEVMKKDIELCKHLGVDGVVIGGLTINGEIDMIPCANLVEKAYPLSVTFHRAFDRAKDPFIALENIIQIGCERILTSGQAPTALQGVSLIQSLQKEAAERIVLLPGGGIRAHNAEQILRETGCKEIHSSAAQFSKSKMNYLPPQFEEEKDSSTQYEINPVEIQKMKVVLRNLASV